MRKRWIVMGAGLGWMWLFWLLLIVGVALIAVVAVRAVGGGLTRGTTEPERGATPARELLDKRFARGEISTEEYRERQRVLDEQS